MSLSLMTFLGNQNPTRDEKYVISQAIKILRFHKYPKHENNIISLIAKENNKTLDNIIIDLKKTLNKEVRE